MDTPNSLNNTVILALIHHQQNLNKKLAKVKQEKIDFTNITTNNKFKENLERQILRLEQQIQALVNE